MLLPMFIKEIKKTSHYYREVCCERIWWTKRLSKGLSIHWRQPGWKWCFNHTSHAWKSLPICNIWKKYTVGARFELNRKNQLVSPKWLQNLKYWFSSESMVTLMLSPSQNSILNEPKSYIALRIFAFKTYSWVTLHTRNLFHPFLKFCSNFNMMSSYYSLSRILGQIEPKLRPHETATIW